MKLRIYILSFISFTVWFASCSNEPECEKFKEGEFSYTKNSTIRILREGNIQKEYDIESDWLEVTKIHWTGPCSYYLTLESTTDPEGTTFKPGDTMWVEITATKDESYTFSASTGSQVFENTMIKLDK